MDTKGLSDLYFLNAALTHIFPKSRGRRFGDPGRTATT